MIEGFGFWIRVAHLFERSENVGRWKSWGKGGGDGHAHVLKMCYWLSRFLAFNADD